MRNISVVRSIKNASLSCSFDAFIRVVDAFDRVANSKDKEGLGISSSRMGQVAAAKPSPKANREKREGEKRAGSGSLKTDAQPAQPAQPALISARMCHPLGSGLGESFFVCYLPCLGLGSQGPLAP